MSSEPSLLERNLGAVFDVMDTDRDGFADEADFTAAFRRFTDEFASTDEPAGRAVIIAVRSWWEGFRADCDGDGDGRVSRAGFAAAHVSGRGQPQVYYQELLSPVVDAILRVLDPDGNGFIGATDYARMFAAHGIEGEFVAAMFQRLDSDGDGRLSTAELQAVFTHLCLSQDSGDPGTAFFGHA